MVALLRQDAPVDCSLSVASSSHDWLLDPELMVKAHLMGVRTLEMNVFSRMRESGSSHVSAMTAVEFLRRLTEFKFGKLMTEWQANLERSS